MVIEGRNAKSASGRRAAAKSVVASCAAWLVVGVVVPLSLLQVPNAIAWVMPPLAAVGASGPQGAASVLRASGLALPVMAAVAPVAALAARRFRAWPVLVAGLLAFELADLLGETARTVAVIGVDRGLHGLGAGIAMPAALALAWERPPRARRLLACWWAAVMVTGLAVAVALIRVRVASGGWRAALQPFPWLTGVALGVTALYAVLAEGTVKFSPGSRQGFPVAERTQLALLAVPVAGLSALALGISYRAPEATLAAAAIETAVLAVLAVMVSRDSVTGGPRCFPVVCAVAGFSLAPAAGAVMSLRSFGPGALTGHGNALKGHAQDALSRHTLAALVAHGPAVLAAYSLRVTAALGGSWLPLTAAGGAALVGVAVALAVRRRGRAVVTAGLLLTAIGLAAAYAAGPLAGGKILALVCVPLAGGLAGALAAALGEATAAGALSGLTILLGGVLTGYLAAGAIQIRMVAALTATASSAAASGGAASGGAASGDAASGAGASGAATPAVTGTAVREALLRAASVWELAGALAAVVAILSVFLVRRACRGGAGSHDHR